MGFQNLKNIMDADTILFIKNQLQATAFNYNYYTYNNTKHMDEVSGATSVYYKVNDNRDSWIDLERAIALKTGSFTDRINAALLDDEFKIDITTIPECKYYDENGYIYTVTPMDGLYDAEFWIPRIVVPDFTDAQWVGLNNDDLQITFPETADIRQALISLNRFFYLYDVIDPHTIVFRNIKQNLTKVRTTGDIREQYDLRVQVYLWDGLNKEPAIRPHRRIGEYLEFYEELNYNYIVIYNGVVYDYELDESNRKRIRLKGLTLTAISGFRLDQVRAYEFTVSAPGVICKKYVTHGIGNRWKNSVDFVLPIQDGIVLYEGVDHEYEVFTNYSIQYPPTLFSILHTSTLADVMLVNFMRGM